MQEYTAKVIADFEYLVEADESDKNIAEKATKQISQENTNHGKEQTEDIEEVDNEEEFIHTPSDVYSLAETSTGKTRKKKKDTFDRIDSLLKKLEGFNKEETASKRNYYDEKNIREREKHELEKELLKLDIEKRRRELGEI